MIGRHWPTLFCSDHTLCLSNDGNVFCCGASFYQSHGFTESIVFPCTMIPELMKVKYVVGGRYTAIILDYEGNVFSFGSNTYGNLGIGNTQLRETHLPQKVDLPPCKQISSGHYFTICLSEDDELYSFGANRYGQLGLGNNDENHFSPQKIESLTDVEFIECGPLHAFCKTKDNTVYSWGYNHFGQLGLQYRDDGLFTPTHCSALPNEEVVDIKCGVGHTLVLTSSYQVLSCGDNTYGNLGRKTESHYSTSFQKIEDLPEITRIECGESHSMCVDSNDDLYVFGNNYQGQLGLGDEDNRYTPMKHPSLSNIIDISKGGLQTFVKTSNNEIYSFGLNKYSQLGIETENEKQLTPIRVFEDNEDIWISNANIKSKAKSARF